MKKTAPSRIVSLLGVIVGLACSLVSARAQVTATYAPSAWVIDPFSFNADDGIINPNTSSPTFTNNGVSLNGNMLGYSPIGATVTLAKPGDTAIFSAQVTMAGIVNTAGNVQTRFGMYGKGASANDTGWTGYMISDPTSSGGGGLYLRNIPNTGLFGSGTGTTQPTLVGYSFATGWNAATYNVVLSVTYLELGVPRW